MDAKSKANSHKEAARTKNENMPGWVGLASGELDGKNKARSTLKSMFNRKRSQNGRQREGNWEATKIEQRCGPVSDCIPVSA